MRAKLCTLVVIGALSVSCGVQRTVITDKDTENPEYISGSEKMVQTKFFGVKFGDKGQATVKSIMSQNGIGYGWTSINKNQWGIGNVEFASYIWYSALVSFTDNSFSHIFFTYKAERKDDGIERYTKMLELLSEKYPMSKNTTLGLGEDCYIYYDSERNIVGVNLLYNEDTKAWMVSLFYSWGKTVEVERAKALNDI